MMIEDLMTSFEIISFDVFDTLLMRGCLEPRDVFSLVEEKAQRRGYAKARIRAEKRANRRVASGQTRGETSLEEIYSFIPRFGDLKDAELEFEKSCIRANPEVVELWARAGELGKRRVIVSDMYLPRPFIEELLRTNGITGWDGIYVSSEHRTRKKTGELYRVMMRDQNVDAARILHVGDNPASDVAAANAVGIAAFQYERIGDRFLRENAFARYYLQEGQLGARRNLIGALAAGWQQYRQRNPSCGYWNKIGFVYGGVLGYAYACFVAREARRRGIKRLLLVYRDGYNLEPIFNELFPDLMTTLIYVPRKVYFYACKDFTDKPHMIAARRRMVWHELEMTGDEQAFLETGVMSKENEEKFERASRKARDEYVRYLSTLKIDNPADVALVDMTTSALSAPKLLESVLGSEITSFYLLAYKPGLARLPSSVVPMFHAHGTSIIFTLMSEFLFTAPTPSVVGIENGVPVYDKAGGFFDEFKANICKTIRPAIIEGARALSQAGVEISRGDLLDYFESFHASVTARDESEFSFAREATGIEQREGRSPLQRELRSRRPLLRLLGRVAISVRVWTWLMRRYATFYLLGRIPILRIRLPF